MVERGDGEEDYIVSTAHKPLVGGNPGWGWEIV